MENTSLHVSNERSSQADLSNSDFYPPTASLLIAFGVGQSYIFHVDKDVRKKKVGAEARNKSRAMERWEAIFKNNDGWSCEQIDNFGKPLGWMVKFTVNEINCPELKDTISHLWDICEKAPFFAKRGSIEAERGNIETFFFTTGVGVLVLRVELPTGSDNTLKSLEAFRNKDDRRWIKADAQQIIKKCAELYTACLNDAEKDERYFFKKPEWTLKRFKEVDREDWDAKDDIYFYPLLFVDNVTYEERIKDILSQVAGSDEQRNRQSDEARVSYERAQVYVDWNEALIRSHTKDKQGQIETDFLIAMASWFALVLMSRLSTIYLFEAFVGIVMKRPQPTANAVHLRNMAYNDVADAALPIRWTDARKDLYLLETIHRNWSSDRWRRDIEERMKLLTLHYERLENEQKERFNIRLTVVGTILTISTLASAAASVIDLAYNDADKPVRHFLGWPLNKIDIYVSLAIPVLVGLLLIIGFRLWKKLR